MWVCFELEETLRIYRRDIWVQLTRMESDDDEEKVMKKL